MISKYRLVYALLLLSFWPVVTIGFICDELLPFLSSIRPAIILTSDAIITIMGLFLLRSKTDIFIVISFFLLAFVTQYVNDVSLSMMFNGMRDFIGILFAIPIWSYLFQSPRRKEFIEKFDRQLFIYLIIQAVCVTEQFLRYGANDHGGGSWGNYYSGIVSTSIYFVSFYLITRRWDQNISYLQNLRNNIWLIVLLYPTFLNETKVSFIYLLLYFALLYKLNRMYVIKLLKLSPVIIGLLIVLVPLYLKVTHQNMDGVFSKDVIVEYFSGGENAEEIMDMSIYLYEHPELQADNIWTVDLPRMLKIYNTPQILRKEPGGNLLGAGLGHFKGGTIVDVTPFAKEYSWLLGGSRPWLFCVMIQMGILGLIWFFTTIVLQTKLWERDNYPFDKNIKLYFIAIILISLIYNDGLRIMQLCLLLYYALAQTTTRDSSVNDTVGEPQPEFPSLRFR